MRCDHQLPCLEGLVAASAVEVNVNVIFWDNHAVLYQVTRGLDSYLKLQFISSVWEVPILIY